MSKRRRKAVGPQVSMADVALILRAQDEMSRVLDKVSADLKRLETEQKPGTPHRAATVPA